MRLTAGVVVCALLCAMHCGADFDPASWRYVKTVSGPSEAGFYALRLDREVLAHAQGSLADVRLIGEDGVERPYELRVAAGEHTVEAIPAQMRNLSRVPGVGTRFELALPAAQELTTEITIETPDRNFRYQVTVEGSASGESWAVLRSDGAIFDFSEDVQARSTVVRLPETTFRYLRVTIHDADARPMHVTGATVRREVVRPARVVEIPGLTPRVEQDRQRDATDILFDLGLPNQPVCEAEVSFGDDNVRRRCEVAVQESGSGQWRVVGSGAIFRYHTTTFTGEQTRFSFPEARGQHVRVSVLNGDDQPLQVTGGRLWSIPRTVVFERDPARPVRLFYGAAVPPPSYDVGEFLRYQQVEPQAGLTLGPEQANPDYREPRGPWTEERPWLLWLVIGLAAVLVGAMIVRMMGQVGSAGDRPAPPS